HVRLLDPAAQPDRGSRDVHDDVPRLRHAAGGLAGQAIENGARSPEREAEREPDRSVLTHMRTAKRSDNEAIGARSAFSTACYGSAQFHTPSVTTSVSAQVNCGPTQLLIVGWKRSTSGRTSAPFAVWSRTAPKSTGSLAVRTPDFQMIEKLH